MDLLCCGKPCIIIARHSLSSRLYTISGGGTFPLSSWNNDALLFLTEKLKLNVLMNTGLSAKLEMFMSEYEAKTVRELPNNIAQVDRIIETLRGKGDEDFKTFCKLLRDSNQVVWADELERMAEQFKRGKGNSSCRRWTLCTMSCSHLLLYSMRALMFNYRVQCLQCLGNTVMLIRLDVIL